MAYEGHNGMGLYARLNLMMDGPNIKVALEAFGGSLYFGQLGIALPGNFGIVRL